MSPDEDLSAEYSFPKLLNPFSEVAEVAGICTYATETSKTVIKQHNG